MHAPHLRQGLDYVPTHYRRWLFLLAMANSLCLLSVWAGFPSTLFGFSQRHVLLVCATGILTIFVLVFAAMSFVSKRCYVSALLTCMMLQMVRLIPSTLAIDSWPGGDDGPLMLWQGIVTPLMWVLAVAGLVVYIVLSVADVGRSGRRLPRS